MQFKVKTIKKVDFHSINIVYKNFVNFFSFQISKFSNSILNKVAFAQWLCYQ